MTRCFRVVDLRVSIFFFGFNLTSMFVPERLSSDLDSYDTMSSRLAGLFSSGSSNADLC